MRRSGQYPVSRGQRLRKALHALDYIASQEVDCWGVAELCRTGGAEPLLGDVPPASPQKITLAFSVRL